MPRISIIVPVYNVERYLSKCIESILAQTFKDFELILVDDGSPDKCPELCDSYAQRDRRIRVIHKANGGLSDARNAGVKEAKGEYIGFVDSDDYIMPEMYQKLYELITVNKADMAACDVYNCYGNKKVPQTLVESEIICNGKEAFRHMLEGHGTINIWVCCKLYKSSIINQVAFIYGKRYEDVFFMVDSIPYIKKVAATTKPLYCYVHREDSITGECFKSEDINIIEAYERCLNMIDKEYPDLRPQGEFRYYWAHFYTLDKMLSCEKYKDIPQYKDVLYCLKKNSRIIIKNKYFTKARRISALCLLINAELYKMISRRSHQNCHKKSKH
jgi:glycosyltransferase involved in cell wall biosynthesis